MIDDISYDVRVYSIEARKRSQATTYRVRWTVAHGRFGKTFATRKLADSFRAALLQSARGGDGFDCEIGLPLSMTRSDRIGRTWYQLAVEFMESKWDDASPRHRKSTAEGLVTLTTALLPDDKTPPNPQLLRSALTHWAFNVRARHADADIPEDFRDPLKWIEANSLSLRVVTRPDGVRQALRAISTKLDGNRASVATVRRKRAALSGALNLAVERRYIPANPLREVRVARQPVSEAIDPRSVVNPEQARALLAAVQEIEPALEAFFAGLYFAALRPAESRNLVRAALSLPETGWGSILLQRTYQEPGTAWTNDGARGEERHLKHRAEQETRPVPAHPELVCAYRAHLQEFGTGVGGRLFVTRTGRGGHPIAPPFQNPVSLSTVYRVWAAARAKALTPVQAGSPLAARPYDLRHACVSTWLHAGVDPTQVAAWAGHSVAVLLRVYAACLDDREALAMQRIEVALRPRRP